MYGIVILATAFGTVMGCPTGNTARASVAVTAVYPDALTHAAEIVAKIERALDGEAMLEWGRLDSDLNRATADLQSFAAAHPDDLGGRLLIVRLGRLLDLVQAVPVTMDSTGVSVGGNLNRHLELHADLDQILSEEPGLAEALYLKARLYATQRPVVDEGRFSTEVNWSAAIDCARAALELLPTERRYRELYALGLARVGSLDEAVAALEQGGLGESLLARIWRDLSRTPIPAGAVPDPRFESVMGEMVGSQIGPYGTERVRAYTVPGTAQDVGALYRERWPGFEWISSGEGEEGQMQFLRFRGDDFQPVGSERDGEKYADEGKGVMLMIMSPEAGAGFGGSGTDRVLILVNYRKK